MGPYLEWHPKSETPYAEPHVWWCERSENESRKKTTSFSSYSIISYVDDSVEISGIFFLYTYILYYL